MSFSETTFQGPRTIRERVAAHRRRKEIGQRIVKIRISASEVDAGATIQSAIETFPFGPSQMMTHDESQRPTASVGQDHSRTGGQ